MPRGCPGMGVGMKRSGVGGVRGGFQEGGDDTPGHPPGEYSCL